jgi:hypothetical protein
MTLVGWHLQGFLSSSMSPFFCVDPLHPIRARSRPAPARRLWQSEFGDRAASGILGAVESVPFRTISKMPQSPTARIRLFRLVPLQRAQSSSQEQALQSGPS